MPDTKLCPACGEELPRSEYHKKASSPDGLQPYCKACNNSFLRGWRGAGEKKQATPAPRKPQGKRKLSREERIAVSIQKHKDTLAEITTELLEREHRRLLSLISARAIAKAQLRRLEALQERRQATKMECQPQADN